MDIYLQNWVILGVNVGAHIPAPWFVSGYYILLNPNSFLEHTHILSYVYIYNIIILLYHILVGGFNPSEKYESQLGCLFPVYGKS